MSRHRYLFGFLFLATAVAGYAMVRMAGSGAFHAAARPDWKLLAAGFAICAAVQPLRALAWSSTVRHPVGFRAIYASSSIGSFLDTVLPGRLGEASKVAVLKVTSGAKYPGFSRAGGSLLCAHLLEMIAFAVLGAGATLFLPVPGWARWTIVGGIAGASGALVLAAVLHRFLGRKLPLGITSFRGGAARCPPPRRADPAGDVARAVVRDPLLPARRRRPPKRRRRAPVHVDHRPREHGADPSRQRRRLPGSRARRPRDRGLLRIACRRGEPDDPVRGDAGDRGRCGRRAGALRRPRQAALARGAPTEQSLARLGIVARTRACRDPQGTPRLPA